MHSRFTSKINQSYFFIKYIYAEDFTLSLEAGVALTKYWPKDIRSYWESILRR